jgi:plasmid stabilization system protein ParE
MNYAFHPEAEEEFLAAIDYYENCRAGLGVDFAREISAAISSAAKYPAMWAQVDIDIHRCLVRRFPYGVLYSIE